MFMGVNVVNQVLIHAEWWVVGGKVYYVHLIVSSTQILLGEMIQAI